MTEFIPFPKIGRLSRDILVTEKIDGTNTCIRIEESGEFLFGSRTRWITPEADNYGFAKWASANKEELTKLGPGTHFGEWWGPGIQRGYGLREKQFSLFNIIRWRDKELPSCVSLVPVLYEGIFSEEEIDLALEKLRCNGSACSPGFMRPEGVVIYHKGANALFKKTLENDDAGKGRDEQAYLSR